MLLFAGLKRTGLGKKKKKIHLVKLRKTSWFGFKYFFGPHKHGWKSPKVSLETPSSAATNVAGDGPTSQQETPVKNIQFC